MPEVPNLEPETEPVEPVAIEPAQPIVEPTVVKLEDTVEFWKQKFSSSSSEANLLREAEAARVKAQQETTKEPTEPELRTAFPLWDSMSDTEKELARRTVRAERIGGNAALEVQEIKAKDSWATSIELVLASNNALQGKEQAFRQYASRPQYRGASMDLIVGSFLQTQGTAPAPKVTPKQGLEPANGGPRTTETPKGLSTDELRALRTSDPKGYQDYLKTHVISIDI
jgi:hypothetical protein